MSYRISETKQIAKTHCIFLIIVNGVSRAQNVLDLSRQQKGILSSSSRICEEWVKLKAQTLTELKVINLQEDRVGATSK